MYVSPDHLGHTENKKALSYIISVWLCGWICFWWYEGPHWFHVCMVCLTSNLVTVCFKIKTIVAIPTVDESMYTKLFNIPSWNLLLSPKLSFPQSVIIEQASSQSDTHKSTLVLSPFHVFENCLSTGIWDSACHRDKVSSNFEVV